MSTADLSLLARAHVDRGIDHLKRHQYTEALAKFDAALRVDRASSQVQVLRCRALARLNRFEEALAAIDQALKQKPNDVIALSERGTVHVAMDQSDKALRDFDTAIRFGAKHAAHYFQRGAAYFNLRDWSRAQADFDVVLAQEKSAPAWFYRGVCRRQLGIFDGALEDLNNATRVNPAFFDAHRECALTLASLGHDKLSLTAIEKWSQLAPRDTDAFLLSAEVRHRLGDDAGAMNDYRRAMEVEPENAKAINGLAWLLATSERAELRDGQESLRLAERANEIVGASDAHILDTLAAARALCGDGAGAQTALDCAIAIASGELKDELIRRRECLAIK